MGTNPSQRKVEKGTKINEMCANLCTNSTKKSAKMYANLMVSGQDMVGIVVELAMGLWRHDHFRIMIMS
jgi:hypothetical protein